ncbi:hypothetical protein CYLTODRAFT_459108 [Cylindrobasidium torrendii FP15055 ss-10]|uniref:Uncharacterized protein n=1 Tax=Cylindrobasidium torrendii FP15055 ss-10 TaxID=1314674 RepID=A0A0D7AWS9_9AGAR|nr:hypothetical protein CYLTODRAFT_459108 [Cylindrobasidium torrendii FP15055 ss-10]
MDPMDTMLSGPSVLGLLAPNGLDMDQLNNLYQLPMDSFIDHERTDQMQKWTTAQDRMAPPVPDSASKEMKYQRIQFNNRINQLQEDARKKDERILLLENRLTDAQHQLNTQFEELAAARAKVSLLEDKDVRTRNDCPPQFQGPDAPKVFWFKCDFTEWQRKTKGALPLLSLHIQLIFNPQTGLTKTGAIMDDDEDDMAIVRNSQKGKGNRLRLELEALVREDLYALFLQVAYSGQGAQSWMKFASDIREMCVRALEEKMPILRLCAGSWKARLLCRQYYYAWFKTHQWTVEAYQLQRRRTIIEMAQTLTITLTGLLKNKKLTEEQYQHMLIRFLHEKAIEAHNADKEAEENQVAQTTSQKRKATSVVTGSSKKAKTSNVAAANDNAEVEVDNSPESTPPVATPEILLPLPDTHLSPRMDVHGSQPPDSLLSPPEDRPPMPEELRPQTPMTEGPRGMSTPTPDEPRGRAPIDHAVEQILKNPLNER